MRQARKLKKSETTDRNLRLLDIIPLTANQRVVFSSFHLNNLMLYGVAGSGKSFIAIYLAMKEVMRGAYDKLLIFRSTVPSRDMGFMPGNAKEKMRVYELPYQMIFDKLFGRGDAYMSLKNHNYVDFETTAFARGMTFENTIILIDECQNMTAQELNTLITRIGEGCKVIFAGDMRQCDLNFRKERSGFRDFYKIIRNMDSFTSVEFGPDDIVRSSLVREYILTRTKLEDEGEINPL